MKRSPRHDPLQETGSPANGFGAGMFHAIVEASPEALLVIEVRRRVLYANPAAERFWGCPASGLLSTAVETLLPGVSSAISAVGDSPSPENAPWEGQALLPGGLAVPVAVRLSTLSNGPSALTLVAVQDLRPRQLAEQRFRLVVESAPNSIVMADAAGRIVLVNRQTEDSFGYPRAELLGQPIETLLPTRFRHRHTAFRDAYQQHPETRSMGAGRELHGLRKDGSEFPVEVGLTPVETDEGLMTLAMIIDISERKHLEEERLRLEEQVLEVSENEQRRIGQDLHDDLCQQLAGIGCLARVAEQQIARTAPSSAPILAEIRDMVTQANIRAREIAHGLVPAVLESEGLNAALQRLASRVETFFDIFCFTRKGEAGHASSIERLSDRELEVFQLIGQGLPSRDSASTLRISIRTVDAHRAHIREKLGLRDGNDLIRQAVRWTETGSFD